MSVRSSECLGGLRWATAARARASLNARRRVDAQLRDGLARSGHIDEVDASARVAELLVMVGLPSSESERYPHEFSGGQRRRICVAGVLAADPKVIVADEPISSLDASAQAQIANLLVSLSRELGVALLLISHDLAIVRHVADEVAVMYLGTVVETAPSAGIWATSLHPYSEALIGTVPRPDGEGRLPRTLTGEVPDPSNPPPGCRFAPRCAYAIDDCTADNSALLAPADNRQVACIRQRPGDTLVRPSQRFAS